MAIDVPVLAGIASTVIFAISAMPMLVKAASTKDLSSYSFGNIALANIGNVVHSLYVFTLPAGPVWFLHGFYLVSTGLMLIWYVAYASPAHPRQAQGSQSRSSACSPTASSTARSSAASISSRYAPLGRT